MNGARKEPGALCARSEPGTIAKYKSAREKAERERERDKSKNGGTKERNEMVK